MQTKEKRGSGWKGDSEGHKRAGSIGGKVTAQIPGHMAAIGSIGGKKNSREHMRAIAYLSHKSRREKNQAVEKNYIEPPT